MPSLRHLSGQEVIRILEKFDFEVFSQPYSFTKHDSGWTATATSGRRVREQTDQNWNTTQYL